MKPSDIILTEPTPLTDTFEKAEREATAAALILTLAANRDEWRWVSGLEVSKHLRDLYADNAVPTWAVNPFLPLDIPGLRDAGWLESKHGSFRFTGAALERLRDSRWNGGTS